MPLALSRPRTSQAVLRAHSQGEITNYSDLRASGLGNVVEDSAKVLTLIDLAGHERYFKTTLFGLTGQIPDYSLVVVSATEGVGPMTLQVCGFG
jgi:GTPase